MRILVNERKNLTPLDWLLFIWLRLIFSLFSLKKEYLLFSVPRSFRLWLRLLSSASTVFLIERSFHALSSFTLRLRSTLSSSFLSCSISAFVLWCLHARLSACFSWSSRTLPFVARSASRSDWASRSCFLTDPSRALFDISEIASSFFILYLRAIEFSFSRKQLSLDFRLDLFQMLDFSNKPFRFFSLNFGINS